MEKEKIPAIIQKRASENRLWIFRMDYTCCGEVGEPEFVDLANRPIATK